MGEAFICRRGGALGSGKSMIVVTAPAGSTVTATCGTITKTAAEKNGTWIFIGCGIGLWTLTATHPNATDTATGNVTIAEDGQLVRYHITLAFWTATITTTYPAGAVCTCSNGDVVLTAPDTSGNCVFTVNTPGEWTVEAVVGGLRYLDTVSATKQKEYICTARAWLYKKGNKCTDITGGWSKVRGNVTIGENDIKLVDSEPERAIVGTVSKLPIAKITTLRINVTYFKEGTGENNSYICLGTNNNRDDLVLLALISKKGIVSLDVSNFSSNAYVCVHSCHQGEPGALTFDEVWAE